MIIGLVIAIAIIYLLVAIGGVAFHVSLHLFGAAMSGIGLVLLIVLVWYLYEKFKDKL